MRRPINPHPHCPETYRLARGWIDGCVAEHSHNSYSELDFRPSRLVWIHNSGEGYNIYLELSGPSDEGVQYVALSYCWGGNQPHKTTKSRLASTRGILSFQEMPRTIQDAIIVTEELGFHYLWIDSLCIVQDDEEEKAREISQMTSIYSQAVVTIAASVPGSVFDGFQDKYHRSVERIYDNIALQTTDGNMHVAGLVQTNVSDHHDMALDRRAWALQEHILSVRILQFRHRQLRFICPAGNQHADGWGHIDGIYQQASQLPQHISDFQQIEDYWHHVVKIYTSRKLTIPADRILAISGIANRLQKLVSDGLYSEYGSFCKDPSERLKECAYIAGHWLSMLPRDVLWHVEQRQSPPVVFQGPSWAWTGVNGEVTFNLAASGKEVTQGQFRTCWEILGTESTLDRQGGTFWSCGELEVKNESAHPSSMYQ